MCAMGLLSVILILISVTPIVSRSLGWYVSLSQNTNLKHIGRTTCDIAVSSGTCLWCVLCVCGDLGRSGALCCAYCILVKMKWTQTHSRADAQECKCVLVNFHQYRALGQAEPVGFSDSCTHTNCVCEVALQAQPFHHLSQQPVHCRWWLNVNKTCTCSNYKALTS